MSMARNKLLPVVSIGVSIQLILDTPLFTKLFAYYLQELLPTYTPVLLLLLYSHSAAAFCLCCAYFFSIPFLRDRGNQEYLVRPIITLIERDIHLRPAGAGVRLHQPL